MRQTLFLAAHRTLGAAVRRRPPVTRRAAALLAVAAATIAPVGCQQTVTSDRPDRVVRSDGNARGDPDVVTPGGRGSGGPTPPLRFDATDPCDANLHELSGLLLEHWLNYRRLPVSLDELRPLADPLQANAFTCPFAKKPYAYLPQASRMVGSVPRLVAHAPAAGPDGLRRAILMRVPQGSQSPATWVVKLTEIELQGQLGSMPPPLATPPATVPTR